ncbi:MAG: KinB-signaling pathway activation protein [Lysinibacillus sp.]
MTIRNWAKFFFYALLVGGAVNGIFSLFIRWDFFQPIIKSGEWGEFFAAFAWMVFLGFTMSVIAQAGFFAYLTLHQVGMNVFKTLTLWNWVQIVLILVTIFDVVFFRFIPEADSANEWIFYIGLLVVLIFGSIATAVQKVKMTGKKHVLISSLFFMIVITTLEWTIALMGQDDNINRYVALLLFPLLAVNAYQLLVLPKYNAKSEEDRLRLEERRKARREQVKNA